jgi:hypothetical protein
VRSCAFLCNLKLGLCLARLQAKAKPSQALFTVGQARPGQGEGLVGALAWPEISESQSQWPGPRLSSTSPSIL